MKQTTNFHLNKPDTTDYYNIQDSNNNMDIIDAEIKEAQDKADQAFQSASNGKAAIKTAITGVDPTVTIPTDATFNQLATAIGQIKTGVDTGDATAAAGDIVTPKTAYVKGVKITGNIPSKAAATFIPRTTDQTIAANQYLSGAQTVKGDANLLSANIKSGVSIFGVSGKTSIVDTADATATEAQMLSSATAYVNGNKITGSMSKHVFAVRGNTGYVTGNPKADGTGVLCLAPTERGYYDIEVNSYGFGMVMAYDPNYVAANILSGKSIFGLAGNAVAGKKVANGTAASSTSGMGFSYLNDWAVSFYYITVSGLTFTPSVVIINYSDGSAELTTIYDTTSKMYPKAVKLVANYPSYSSVNNSTVKGDTAGAYVNSTGFRLPIYAYVSGTSPWSWIAYE